MTRKLVLTFLVACASGCKPKPMNSPPPTATPTSPAMMTGTQTLKPDAQATPADDPKLNLPPVSTDIPVGTVLSSGSTDVSEAAAPPKASELDDFAAGELQLEVLSEGNGTAITANSEVAMRYTASLLDGQTVASSEQRGRVGAGDFIAGIDQALTQLKRGSTAKATLPSNLAFGQRGLNNPAGEVLVPPGATVVVEIEVLNTP